MKEYVEKRRLDASLATAFIPFMRSKNGPGILFRQSRVGCGEYIENGLILPDMAITKIKSMPDSDVRSGISVTGCRHPDAGPVSAIARSLRIDESPQLWNVLKGTMSIVGPRPRTVDDVEEIFDSLSPRERQEWLNARKMAKPGLAHPGAAAQYRDGYVYDPREIAGAEIEYVESASLAGDLMILRDIAGALVGSVKAKLQNKPQSFAGQANMTTTIDQTPPSVL